MTTNKYREIMDFVDLDEQSSARILQNIHDATGNPKKSKIISLNFHRYGTLAACIAVLLLGVLTTGIFRIINPLSGDTAPASTPAEGISSASDLTEKSGIIIKDVTPIAVRSEKTEYQVSSENGAEIVYNTDDQIVTFHKYRNGTYSEDDSQYDLIKEARIGRFIYTLKGREEQYYTVQWTDGEFSYHMSFDHGQPENEILQIVSGVTKPSAADLEAINSGIEYPKDDEYLDWYHYATVSAPHGHSVYGFGSADHAGTAHTVLNGERVLVLAERKGYACVIVLSQNKGRWINKDHLIFDQETIVESGA